MSEGPKPNRSTQDRAIGCLAFALALLFLFLIWPVMFFAGLSSDPASQLISRAALPVGIVLVGACLAVVVWKVR
jgi:hypothetical protein